MALLDTQNDKKCCKLCLWDVVKQVEAQVIRGFKAVKPKRAAILCEFVPREAV